MTWTKHILDLVDDARQYSNDWTSNQMINILSKLQHVSQTWEHLLATTGGKLKIPKCAVYTLKWIFNTHGIPSLDKDCKAKIRISSSETSEHTTIPHLPNDVPFKYLGVYTTPIGDQHCQLRETVQIAKRGARIISSNTFDNFQARLYVNTYLNNKLYYPLPSISFSSKQYDLIHKAYIPHAISSMVYNRTWSLVLRYGIHDYGGL